MLTASSGMGASRTISTISAYACSPRPASPPLKPAPRSGTPSTSALAANMGCFRGSQRFHFRSPAITFDSHHFHDILKKKCIFDPPSRG